MRQSRARALASGETYRSDVEDISSHEQEAELGMSEAGGEVGAKEDALFSVLSHFCANQGVSV